LGIEEQFIHAVDLCITNYMHLMGFNPKEKIKFAYVNNLNELKKVMLHKEEGEEKEEIHEGAFAGYNTEKQITYINKSYIKKRFLKSPKILDFAIILAYNSMLNSIRHNIKIPDVDFPQNDVIFEMYMGARPNLRLASK